MATVNIPLSFFFEEAKKEYYNYQERLICEIIQNSYDAGAKKIDINVDNNSYEIIDDGKGMTKERMISALLTMGGSQKDICSTGGFGAAKKLILFSHKNYEIHSLDTHVFGEQLNYEFIDDNSFFNGTKIKCEFLPQWNHKVENFVSTIKSFLKKCKLNSDVFINGEKFTDWKNLPVTRTLNWGASLCCGKSDYGSYIHIRHNGLFMFASYISDLNKDVVLEVTGKSTDLFTQNRDGFTGKYRDYFSALINEISIDKRSFANNQTLKRIYIKGKNGIISTVNRVREKLDEIKLTNEILATLSDDQIISMLKNGEIKNSTNTKLNLDYLYEENFDFNNDFIYDLINSDFSELPKEFAPKTILKRNKFIAYLWKNCLLEIMRVHEVDKDFLIGFTFNPKTEALFSRDKETKNDCYLINPLKYEFDSKKAKFCVMKLLVIALHEFTHSGGGEFDGNSYHDEDYAASLTSLVYKTLGNEKFSGWRGVYEKTKLEMINQE